MDNDICHICLEDVEFIPINLLKDCCDAFICNECWLNITDNNLISNCPICNHPLNSIVPTTLERMEPSFINNYEKYICGLLKFLSWIMVGYTSVSMLVFISHSGDRPTSITEIKELSTKFEFWLSITPFGYIVQTMIIYLLRKCFS